MYIGSGWACILFMQKKMIIQLCRVGFLKVVFFFGKSCWDVVYGVCWERVFLGAVDTGKVCILRMVWRVRVKLSGVGWLS